MSKTKKTVILHHNGVAYAFSPQAKAKLLAAVLGGTGSIDWQAYGLHLGDSYDVTESVTSGEIAALLAKTL